MKQENKYDIPWYDIYDIWHMMMIIQYENHFLTILVTHKDKKKTFRTV